jgi:hypothetical protein
MSVSLVAFVERYTVPVLSDGTAPGHWSPVATFEFGDHRELRLFLRQHASERWPHDSPMTIPALKDDGAYGETRVWCAPPLVSMAVRGGLPLEEVTPELRALQQALFTLQAHGCKTRVLWSLA